jgi:hypothetical protein
MSRAALLAASMALAVLAPALHADPQQPPSLPNPDAFFAATRDNLARAQREQYRYAYKERRSDLHVNPFGSKVGTGGTSVYEVTPIAANVTYRTLIEHDGKPVSDSTPERQERKSREPLSTGSMIDDIVDGVDDR